MGIDNGLIPLPDGYTRVGAFIVVPRAKTHPFFEDEAKEEEVHIWAWLRQKSNRTKKIYTREIQSFLAFFPGLLIKNVKATHISLYLSRRDHQSKATQKLAKDSISSLLTFCGKIGYISNNPAYALDSIKVDRHLGFKALTEDQIRAILKVPKKARDKIIVKLLFLCGFRVSELCSLNWANLLFVEDRLQFMVLGKGGQTRSVSVNQSVWNEIAILRRGEKVGPRDPIFQSQKGHRLSTTQVWRIVKSAAKLAGLREDVTTHTLRHAHAVIALRNGADLSTIQHTLGHSSLAVTSIYLSAFPGSSSADSLLKFTNRRCKAPG